MNMLHRWCNCQLSVGQVLGNVVAWTLGIGALLVLISLSAKILLYNVFPTDTKVSWYSTGITFATGPSVLLFSRFIQRNPKLQVLTWIPVPIALVSALWIVEETMENVLQEMLQAAFAATFIGVAFDATLLIGISTDLKSYVLWPVVTCATVVATVSAYFAATNVVAAFCLGVVAAAMNILNIPHITKPLSNTSTRSSEPAWVIIPLVWVLLTTSIILQELEFYTAAGIISNAPCMHFVVAFMLWWTSTHGTADNNEKLVDTVLLMVDNIGIGSVAVFSSSVFTAIFWQGLTHHSNIWMMFGIAVGVSLAVSVIMYFYTWVPSSKERYQKRYNNKVKYNMKNDFTTDQLRM